MAKNLFLPTNQAATCLKIVFERRNDRWSHRFIVANGQSESGQSELVFLRSVEGDADQPWPPSPPLQEASHQDLDTCQAVLAVGMAGKSHWSASFSYDQDQSFLADLACLCKNNSPGQWIGSRYELGRGVEMVLVEEGGEFLLEDLRLLIRPVADTSCKTQLAVENRVLTFKPLELSTEQGRPTRWGYQVKFMER